MLNLALHSNNVHLDSPKDRFDLPALIFGYQNPKSIILVVCSLWNIV